MDSERARANIHFESKQELEELRMRMTFLGYSSMGAYISNELNLKTPMFNVRPEMKELKKQKEKDDE